MKLSLIALLLLTINAYAWETSDCYGTKKERLSALKILGNHARLYKKQYGAIPDLMNEDNPKFRADIPTALNGYLISNWDAVSIGYMCNLPSPKDKPSKTEECYINIETKKIRCGGLSFEAIPNE